MSNTEWWDKRSDRKNLSDRAFDYLALNQELMEGLSQPEFWEVHNDLVLELEGAVEDRLLEWKHKRQEELVERETDRDLDLGRWGDNGGAPAAGV